VKNQYLVAHNLAEYLPEPDDPRYAQYEKTLPQYRASLEARYPQVCRNCEPRVRERLKLTGYAAKTDHLRRLAESTRQARSVARGGYGLNTLIMGGGICWWLAHISQIFWHARNLSRLIPTVNSYPLDKLGLTDDLLSLLGTWSERIDFEKVDTYTGAVSIAFTLCSIWWNPVLTRGSRRNWRGLGEFYKLQAVLVVTRLASWQLLESGNLHDLAARRAIHAAALGFNLFVGQK
jgi:Ima1 N-terminal domain